MPVIVHLGCTQLKELGFTSPIKHPNATHNGNAVDIPSPTVWRKLLPLLLLVPFVLVWRIATEKWLRLCPWFSNEKTRIGWWFDLLFRYRKWNGVLNWIRRVQESSYLWFGCWWGAAICDLDITSSSTWSKSKAACKFSYIDRRWEKKLHSVSASIPLEYIPQQRIIFLMW